MNSQSRDPISSATADVAKGLLDRLEGVEDTGAEPPGTAPSHLRSLLDEIIRRGDLPTDKLSRWLGFVQGTMAAAGLLSVEDERARTRPIFHAAYAEAGLDAPSSVDVAAGSYDDERMAKDISFPLRAWADHGFNAGFILPGAASRLVGAEMPSSVFLLAFSDRLGHPDTLDAAELARRMDFGERVQERLFEIEKAALVDRATNVRKGFQMRIGFAVAVTAMMLSLLAVDLPFHALLLVLASIGAAAFSRRVIAKVEQALGEVAAGLCRTNIVLPWERRAL